MKSTSRTFPALLGLLASLSLAAAANNAAICVLEATSNSATPVTGSLVFSERSDGNLDVLVVATGLSTGNHGFHVHTYGDISSPDGMSPGGHFIGDCNNQCRPAGVLQEVGMLNNGIPLVADGSGNADFSFIEGVARLSGPNSIIGRAIVIHGDATNSGIRVAQCVIGREVEDVNLPAPRPTVTQATCRLKATDSGGAIAGTVTFTQAPTTSVPNGVWVSYDVSGLSPTTPSGPHGFHVHQLGDVAASTGASVAGHFYGVCDNCRPGASAPLNDEVGALFDGIGISVDGSGSSTTMRFDGIIQLGGVNNIVGRSLIIHGTATDAATRVAQCVIGEAMPVTPTDCAYAGWTAWSACSAGSQSRTRAVLTQASNGGNPCIDASESRACDVPSAVCILEATSNNKVPVYGTVSFVEHPDTNLTVTLDVSGLVNGQHHYHVHTYGDISNPDGSSVAGHFVGLCDDCRPADQLQEVGLLNDGIPFVVADGAGSVTYLETVAKLSGPNSILGRSIIIHGDGFSSGPRVAQCVIGRQSEESSVPVSRPLVTQATCRMKETDSASGVISGEVTFTTSTSPAGVWVSYNVQGLPPGSHPFHVHAWGNIQSTDATGVGGHFFGNCVNCRPGATEQSVGYLFNGAGITADASGVANDMKMDSIIELDSSNGRNIVARSLVIHDGSQPSLRIAQCTIGEALVVTPTDCSYSPWKASQICGCDNNGACTMSESRSIVTVASNGGTACGTDLSTTASCTTDEHQDSSRVSVALSLPGLTRASVSPVDVGNSVQEVIANSLGVPTESIVNLRATDGASTLDLAFDVLTTTPSVVTSRAEQVFSSDSAAFASQLSSATSLSVSSVTLTSMTEEDGDSGSGGLSGSQKAGIAVGVMMFVGIMAVAMAYFIKNRGSPSYTNSAMNRDDQL